MLLLACHSINERVKYASHIFFGIAMRVDYEVILIDQIKSWVGKFPAASLVYYSPGDSYGEGSIRLVPDGLLDELDIRKIDVTIQDSEALECTILLSDHMDRSGAMPFDPMAASFWLSTEYEVYADPQFDSHGRYDERYYPRFKKDLCKSPLIHVWAEAFYQILEKKNPLLHRRSARFDYQVTFDIDQAYAYRGKSTMMNAMGLMRDTLLGRMESARLRMRYLSSGTDPFDTYSYISDRVTADKLCYFFLSGGSSANDRGLNPQSDEYKNLVKNIADRGIAIGIHPSYNAFLDPPRLISEKGILETASGKATQSARMHFLKYRLPETRNYLLSAGVRHDYTGGMYSRCGFRNGLCRPFPWFDLKQNKETDLIVHPFMAMDRTLQKYLGLPPAESIAEISDVFNQTIRYHGNFCILFHNSSLSDAFEWKGWRQVFDQTIDKLKQTI